MGCAHSAPAADLPARGKDAEAAAAPAKGPPVQAAAAAERRQDGAHGEANGVYKHQAPGPPAYGRGLAPDGEAPSNGSKQAADPMAADNEAPSSPLMVVWRDVDVPLPLDEQHRWDELVDYNILDTEPEEAYDRITELCKNLFKVPIAMVTFVDKDRVWLKSVQGLPGLKQVERRSSLCAWTLLSRYPEALVVGDLREDVRFKDFPVVVGWPHVRFYAASPLVTTGGSRLGTLCILDLEPREFSAESTSLLAQLANMVMREVERKRAMNHALCSAALRRTSGDNIIHDRQGLMLLDTATPKWHVHLVNDAWQRITGVSQEMAAGGRFWDLFEPPAPAQVQACQLAVEQRRNFELRVPCNASGSFQLGSFSSIGCSHDGLLPSHTFSTGSSGGGGGGGGSVGGARHQGSIPLAPLRGGGASSGPGSADGPWAGLGSAGAGAGALQQLQAPPSAADAGSRRRSIGGAGSVSGGASVRYVRFQFRSVSSAGSHMGPVVSIPPSLLARDAATNFYWATVDLPSAQSQHGGEDSSYASLSGMLPPCGAAGMGLHCRVLGSESDSGQHAGGSSGQHAIAAGEGGGGGGGGGSSGAAGGGTPSERPKTTFSLMPEDNPFQDITIGSLLGWGSYGRVHRGYWNGSLVAVKVLEQVAGDSNPRSSLEPLLHHRLSHPNVVAMFDICTQEVDVCEDGRPLQEVWMVLEFCNRGTLSDAIQRGWLLTVRDGAPQPGHVNILRALTTAREVAGALEYLHSQNVLHGDLNGNNILLAGAPVTPDRADHRGFTAKVADFGLSRLLTPENEKIITRTHGTITHMAPEVITEATHSKAADVYSFGVVLFELVSGSKPYHGMHYAQIVSSITSGKLLQLLPQAAPHLPPELLQLMAACLATKPIDRPTFHEVHQRLLQLEVGLLAAPPPPAPVLVPMVGPAGAQHQHHQHHQHQQHQQHQHQQQQQQQAVEQQQQQQQQVPPPPPPHQQRQHQRLPAGSAIAEEEDGADTCDPCAREIKAQVHAWQQQKQQL